MVFCSCLHWCYSELLESAPLGEEIVLFQKLSSVYTSSKYEQPVFSVSKYDQQTTLAPSSASIMTADEIRKYGRAFRIKATYAF